MTSLASFALPRKTVRLADPHILAGLAALVAVSFFSSYRSLFPLLGSESAQAVLLVIPLAAFALLLFALPKAERVVEEVFVNFLFALPMLIALFALLVILPAKLSFVYWAYRLDLLAVPAFVAFALILFYGLPGVWAARPALALLLLGWPPLLDTLTRVIAPPLARLDALLVGMILNVASPGIERNGDVFLVHGDFVQVSSACAGLLAIVSMVVLGSVVALASHGSPEAKLRWFATGIALALVVNVLRIALILYVAEGWGLGPAFKLFHLFSGALLFAACFLAMLLLLGRFGLVLRRPDPESEARTAQPTQRVALIAASVIAVAALGFFATVRMDFRGAGLFDRTATVRSQMLLPHTAESRIVSREPAPWIAQLFGSGAQAAIYYYRWPNGAYTSAQVIVTGSYGELSRYGLLECFVTHGFQIYATEKRGLPFGGTAQVIALRDGTRDLVATVWVQPVRIDGRAAWRRVALYQYIDAKLGDAAQVNYRGPLGLWLVNRVLPYGGTKIPERFTEASARAQLLAANVVQAG